MESSADLTAALIFLKHQSLPSDSVAVEAHPYPVLRYLYEYGPFAGDPTYPSAFRIPPDPAPRVSHCTRYLVSFGIAADARAAYPKATLVDDASLPPNLYRLQPGQGCRQ